MVTRILDVSGIKMVETSLPNGPVFIWDSGDIYAIVPLLYFSGLNMMEGILTKSNWLRFPPKPKETEPQIMGGDFI